MRWVVFGSPSQIDHTVRSRVLPRKLRAVHSSGGKLPDDQARHLFRSFDQVITGYTEARIALMRLGGRGAVPERFFAIDRIPGRATRGPLPWRASMCVKCRLQRLHVHLAGFGQREGRHPQSEARAVTETTLSAAYEAACRLHDQAIAMIEPNGSPVTFAGLFFTTMTFAEQLVSQPWPDPWLARLPP